MNKKILSIVLASIWFLIMFLFFIWIFQIPIYFMISILLSCLIIFWLNKFNIRWWIYITFFIILTNIWFLIFLLVPIYDKEVNISWFYNQQQNKIIININDEQSILEDNNTILSIRNRFDDTVNMKIKLYNIKDKQYEINLDKEEWYIISFISKSKLLSSTVNIYLWDWTILRILPQSTIKINKIIKDDKNILKSKTDIELSQWNIWFNIMRTLLDDEWFSIRTQNWTIAIRWTAWLVTFDSTKWDSIIYSHNHIIEIKNKSDKTTIIKKWEIIKFDDNEFITSDYDELFYRIWENIENKINSIIMLDDNDINNYKNSLNKYIEENFWREFEKYKFLDKLGKLKLMILKQFDAKKYIKNIKNYEKYQIIKWNYDNIKYNFWDNLNDIIIVPINEKMNSFKLEYLNNLSKKDPQIAKSFIINSYNKLLDLWENIDKDEISDILNSINIWEYEEKINRLYKNIYNKAINIWKENIEFEQINNKINNVENSIKNLLK